MYVFCSEYRYAEVVVATETSLKMLLDKVPQCKIGGENLNCRTATYQSLAIFETIAKKRKEVTFHVQKLI